MSDVVMTATAEPARALTLTLDQRWLAVRWDDDVVSRYHYLWLRDNCLQSRHASTGHRTVETSSIPDDLHPLTAEITTTGELRIEWANDSRVSTYPFEWLRTHDYSNGQRIAHQQLVLWNAAMIDRIPEANYPELLADTDILRSFLGDFVRYGLGILHHVPCEPGAVLDVAEQFGEIRTTSWGRLFDVVSMEDANSVAYTNLPLVAHTDEAYRDPAPTIQLQHVLRSDASGGASTLADGFRIADDLRHARPDAFELLALVPLQFHFADSTAEHEYVGPIIELSTNGEVRSVRFSNHSVRPFLIPFEMMDPFYDAYRLFGAMREAADYQLRIRLGAGDLYMVDNRRVMHGRTGFSSGGARHLQSCYIERDELVSRLTVLNRSQPFSAGRTVMSSPTA